MVLRHTLTVTPLGEVCLVAEDDQLCGLYLPHHHPAPAPSKLGVWVSPADSVLSAAADELHAYLAGTVDHFTVAYRVPASGFKSRVWREVSEIPYGYTAAYSEVAQRLGNAQAARAVGIALAHNPLAIVVPCHRVVTSGGDLGGYAGGVEAKRYLLQLERNHSPRRRGHEDLFSLWR